MAGEHTLTFNIIMLPMEAEIILNKRYNDSHNMFSFQYNSWSTQASVWMPGNIFQLI